MKVLNYLKIGVKAIGKFLKYAYAPQITNGALSVVIYLTFSRFVGAVFFVWSVLLAINEYKQNQSVK